MKYPEIKIVDEEVERGFKKGNKPKKLRKVYEGKPKETEELNKQELRNEAAVKFISHNINMNKWWNDP
jgi:hypothetical protein